MGNWGAVVAGYGALLFGIYYCMFGDPQISIFHGLIFVGMTNIMAVECYNEKKNYFHEYYDDSIYKP